MLLELATVVPVIGQCSALDGDVSPSPCLFSVPVLQNKVNTSGDLLGAHQNLTVTLLLTRKDVHIMENFLIAKIVYWIKHK